MKHRIFSRVFLLTIFSSIIFFVHIDGQIRNPSPSSWFKTTKVADNVWCIDDHLVIGNDSALIIDTGIGAANLRDYVKSITHLPLIVVNTHAIRIIWEPITSLKPCMPIPGTLK